MKLDSRTPVMYNTFLILFALVAQSMGISLSQRHPERRDTMLNTDSGCVSYTSPYAVLLYQSTVTQQYSGGSVALNSVDLTTCLNEYGCGIFSDSWQGNVCGGRGWFKGPPSNDTSSSECYRDLAPWVLLNGIQAGNTYYKAMLGKHCYMGYNEPESDSSSS